MLLVFWTQIFKILKIQSTRPPRTFGISAYYTVLYELPTTTGTGTGTGTATGTGAGTGAGAGGPVPTTDRPVPVRDRYRCRCQYDPAYPGHTCDTVWYTAVSVCVG